MSKPLSLADVPFGETLQEEPSAPTVRNLFVADAELRRQSARYWLVHPLKGGLGALFTVASRYLPRDFVSNAGARLSRVARRMYRNKPFSKRIAGNYSALTRELSGTRTDAVKGLDRWWANIGRTYAEFGILNTFYKEARIEVEGAEYLDQVHMSGDPVIFCAVHLATWETLTSALQALETRDLVSTFEPEQNRFTNRLVHAIRKERHHYAFPPGQKSAFRLHRLMASGNYSACFFVDEVRNKQIHLPLFGRELPTRGNAVAAVKLANKCSATLVPTYLTRTGPARFKLVICPPLLRERPAASYDVAKSIEALNAVLEPAVLRHIDEWYMLAELRLPMGFIYPDGSDARGAI